MWILKNPATLPVILTFQGDRSIKAEFPALEVTALGGTIDEAVLNLAKAIQSAYDKKGVPHGPDVSATA